MTREKLSWHVKTLIPIISLVGVVTAGVVFLFDTWVEQNKLIVILVGIHSCLTIHLAWCLVVHKCPSFYESPRILKVIRESEILVVEKTPWLANAVSTAIYVEDDILERFVGGGFVINVQLNGLVQIKVETHELGMSEVWEVIQERRDSLIIRPGLYQGT